LPQGVRGNKGGGGGPARWGGCFRPGRHQRQGVPGSGPGVKPRFFFGRLARIWAQPVAGGLRWDFKGFWDLASGAGRGPFTRVWGGHGGGAGSRGAEGFMRRANSRNFGKNGPTRGWCPEGGITWGAGGYFKGGCAGTVGRGRWRHSAPPQPPQTPGFPPKQLRLRGGAHKKKHRAPRSRGPRGPPQGIPRGWAHGRYFQAPLGWIISYLFFSLPPFFYCF